MSQNTFQLREAIDGLDDPTLHDLIQSDRATLGMIRPLAEDNIDPRMLEGTAHDTLERSISGFRIYRKFLFTFDEQVLDEFYTGRPRTDQLQRPAEHYAGFVSRWHEFVHIMTAGQTTGLILHSPEGGAAAAWRRQLGYWNVEQERDSSTLRGKFALRNFNNLFHGSDDPETAMREVRIIVGGMRRQLHQLSVHEIN